MSNLDSKEYKTFEEIKHTKADGYEFWLARELATTLVYIQWRNFSKVIDRAMFACKNSGYDVLDHFAEISKIIKAGSAPRKIKDCMGSTELIANLFRISQTEEKIRKDGVSNKDTATETHYVVGKEIRQAIERVGGTIPENLPVPVKSITEIEKDQLKKLKKSKNKLMLDE